MMLNGTTDKIYYHLLYSFPLVQLLSSSMSSSQTRCSSILIRFIIFSLLHPLPQETINQCLKNQATATLPFLKELQVSQNIRATANTYTKLQPQIPHRIYTLYTQLR